MRHLFSRPLFPYVLSIFIILIVTGGILSIITDHYVVLFSVLLINFILFTITLLYVFDKYIKPIKIASKTVDHLVKGNYSARVHHPANGMIGILSSKINTLARSLSELSIHEQIQAEQLSTVIDNTESGLVLIDEKGYIHLVNDAFISMFGKTEENYVGYLYYEVMHNKKIQQTIQDTFLYEKKIKDSFTYFNDTTKHYEIVGAPIFNNRNVLKGAVIVIYDITEFKQLEGMRKDFIANVSQELEQPIATISKSSGQLLEQLNKADDVTKLKKIHADSQRLDSLVGDLMILTKLERDDFSLNIQTINISKLLNEIMPDIKERTKAKNISLFINIDDELKIKLDFDKIKLIISHLLSNAISYTYAGGEITLNIKEENSYLYIQVKDTGIGIENKHLPRIYERFYRVDESRSINTGGTGLGLAIVKHVTELHGGKIMVESKVNKGTTFTVYLPV